MPLIVIKKAVVLSVQLFEPVQVIFYGRNYFSVDKVNTQVNVCISVFLEVGYSLVISGVQSEAWHSMLDSTNDDLHFFCIFSLKPGDWQPVQQCFLRPTSNAVLLYV